jgi:hypothetical protein
LVAGYSLHLGVMLAVRRSGVTDALHEFAMAGLITTGRARVTVMDRGRLLVLAAATTEPLQPNTDGYSRTDWQLLPPNEANAL